MVSVHSYQPSREGWQHQQRQQNVQNGRYELPTRRAYAHDLPLTVTQALKDCARIPIRNYALVVIFEDGQEDFFSSSKHTIVDTKPIYKELRRTATLENNALQPSMPRGSNWNSNPAEIDTSFGSNYNSGSESRRRRRFESSPDENDSDDEPQVSRKRTRSGRGSRTPPSSMSAVRTQQIRIGDEEKVAEFYSQRWRDLQQTGCKIVGKALVKAIEPKKQTHHPYTKGDKCAPDWWPSTSGENKVRHKEPDHLYKKERVALCEHIINLVVQPNEKQLECFRALGLNIKKLEEFTMEQMNVFFSNPDQPKNKEKKKYLKEIFKVAKQQERYRAGQLPGDTCVSVMSGGDFRRNAVNYASSDDEGSETEADDATIQHQQRRSLNSNVPFPHQPQPGVVAPVQHTHFDVAPMFEQPRTFEAQNPMAFDQDRRSYGSPAYSQASNSYSWTPSPASLGSTPPSTYYTTSPIAGQAPVPYTMGPTPSITATLPPLQHNYDAPRYDMNPMSAHPEPMRQDHMGHPSIPNVNTSFADTMFNAGQYGAPGSEHVYHPQH